ncbi:MAG: hydroxymethylglutaryl-CoA lyase [Actinobacteria bacterium]|nr:hydroxymethylglutaryl-CoA lyase [Actinomycetota bacterium]MSW76646.1 hydroxymethylglutaryl-CoA lyase [Actinomycetota bacterium]MSX54119.1 hydroxymethylglutaryl-CoA lyase [Actinomycetota bacterium]MSX91781.1 hydroxymethylglutaryl-CoA lyase [Actinomycetota bacterium]MSZ82093.1 hydroxymethylglutaryl-CoA lyase [Actinomycetota bacterium]
MPARIIIREVGARDGLQAEQPISVDQRLELLDALLIAGVTHLEVASFVSPKAVPSMAGAADVVAGLGAPEGVVRTALVPNVRGAEMALAAGLDELTVTVSASAVYNERNVKMTIDESVESVEAICALASAAGVPVDAVISCAFGSPYEGDIKPAAIALLAERLRASGASAITLADTTGMATPRRIQDVLALTGTDVGLHLHETRGTGLLNAYAGLLAGVRRFDTSVGGLGGSPFAAGAAGNVATEELVALCDDLGVSTGIGIDALIEAALLVEGFVGHSIPSRVAKAGPRSRRA